jgi:hypothetical protein
MKLLEKLERPTTVNAAWHEHNPMPKNATLEQRVKWHAAHAKACACRPIPKSVAAHLRSPESGTARRKSPTPGSGYSGTPLAGKLGLVAGKTILLLGAPPHYASLVGPSLADLKRAKALGPAVDIVHMFTAARSRLATALLDCRRQLRSDAAIWVSWPKRASGVQTDITEDTIREIALPLGFVDIKVCAVDETWSGLKLMLRKELR